jgi:hypothetical protein
MILAAFILLALITLLAALFWQGAIEEVLQHAKASLFTWNPPGERARVNVLPTAAATRPFIRVRATRTSRMRRGNSHQAGPGVRRRTIPLRRREGGTAYADEVAFA